MFGCDIMLRVAIGVRGQDGPVNFTYRLTFKKRIMPLDFYIMLTLNTVFK